MIMHVVSQQMIQIRVDDRNNLEVGEIVLGGCISLMKMSKFLSLVLG